MWSRSLHAEMTRQIFGRIQCFFFPQVNLEYLEAKLESLDGDEVLKIKGNINGLFHHCIQALGEEHQIKVVNALQVRLVHLL